MMVPLHNPDNIKVHFAGCEMQNQFLAVRELGVSYGLYTCFPFVERMVFGKGISPIMPLKTMLNPAIDIPTFCATSMKHCIQDSGLFTLMFGSQAKKHDGKIIERWYEAMIEFTKTHNGGCTCVEVDCQKVLGVDEAWRFRERMRNDLPNRVINVFHLEDGKKGLDRLIEFSDYIAISVPELRFAKKKNFVYPLACYIKNKKPNIDIHLLGCTEIELLHKCNFCTSADSTSYIAGKRFGYILGKHISSIKTNEVKRLVGVEKWERIATCNNETNTNFLCLSIEHLKREYEKSAGNQDYYYMLNKNSSK